MTRRVFVAFVLVMLIAVPAWASNDDLFPRQWGLGHIKVPEAWPVSKGSGIVIAVIDTGVDLGHPDLSGENKLIRGPDLRNSDSEPQDDHGHGTHVAGIAAAASENNLGIAGVAPVARIMAIKVLGSGGTGSTSDVIRAIDFASTNGAHVINLSLGDLLPIEALHNTEYDHAIKRAKDRGSVVVAAAGNDGYPFADPATAEFALIVGATDKSGQRAPYSNSGPGVNVWAPGGNDITSLQFFCSQDPAIWSTYLRGKGECQDDYDQKSGTSMAAPHVAGVSALVRAVNPSLGPVGVRDVIINSADTIGEGLKRVNAARAVNHAKGAGSATSGGGSTGGSAPNNGSRTRGSGSSRPAGAQPGAAPGEGTAVESPRTDVGPEAQEEDGTEATVASEAEDEQTRGMGNLIVVGILALLVIGYFVWQWWAKRRVTSS